MQPEPVRPLPIRSLPMQSKPIQLLTNPPHANAPPAEHHIIAEHGGIVAAVWRIFVKDMRVTR